MKLTLVQTLKKLLSLLTLEEFKSAAWLMIMMLLTALLDTIGIASIVPFIAVLANPDVIQTNSILNTISQTKHNLYSPPLIKIFG